MLLWLIKFNGGCKDTYVVGGISNAEYRVAGCVFNGCYKNTIVVGLMSEAKTGMGMGDRKEDVQRGDISLAVTRCFSARETTGCLACPSI
ncbi:unnamed protein product [Sphenostylis stenocarpa]|uniref:Uncharacterized protein n=1 Tax=Sphenostylis stenocarpa TaxID=92480 RepID=A0AA86V980_9FABA|nr:unnamed protein product [Sphenostylis stenocarpa]